MCDTKTSNRSISHIVICCSSERKIFVVALCLYVTLYDSNSQIFLHQQMTYDTHNKQGKICYCMIAHDTMKARIINGHYNIVSLLLMSLPKLIEMLKNFNTYFTVSWGPFLKKS